MFLINDFNDIASMEIPLGRTYTNGKETAAAIDQGSFRTFIYDERTERCREETQPLLLHRQGAQQGVEVCATAISLYSA
ncbi:hypothetical protein D3C86_1954460 [compost metagenome]